MTALQILDTLPSPASGPVGLAYDGHYLWNSDFNSSRVYCLDLATGETLRSLINPGTLSGLAWDGRSLWCGLHSKGWIRRTNPETNDFDQTIVVADHGWLSGVTWDGEQLWAASQQRGLLFALDAETGELRRTIPAPVAGGGLAWGYDLLWLAHAFPMRYDAATEAFEWESPNHGYAIVALDPADGREVTRFTTEFLPMGLAWVDDDLWLADMATARLHRAQPRLP